MADLIKAISSKQEWQTKIERESLVKKWAQELESQGYSPDNLKVAINVLRSLKNTPRDMKAYVNVFTWNIFENDCHCKCLNCYDSYAYDKNDEDLMSDEAFVCKCAASVGQKRKEFLEALVVKKSGLIHDVFRNSLIQEVSALEAQPPDWHPESNEQVLDLVHPSLFCYVDGITKVLPEDRRYNKKPQKPNALQWLPAEVEIQNGNARFVTEINNLPRSQNISFYFVIENIFNLFLPGLTACLNKYLKSKEEPVQDLRNLQVIVKLASTVLTPEKPEFPGGNWHLEGHADEHIVATGIYYYQNENIVDSGLYTRIPLKEGDEENLSYGQDDFKSLPVHYLLKPEREQVGIQHLGSVQTNENDCLIFPNFVQHKVSTFKLGDPTKPGVRKILLFWIVNPNVKILSTGDVEKPNYNLRDAKLYREMLMYQRKNEVDERKKLYETELSLCEH